MAIRCRQQTGYVKSPNCVFTYRSQVLLATECRDYQTKTIIVRRQQRCCFDLKEVRELFLLVIVDSLSVRMTNLGEWRLLFRQFMLEEGD